MKVLGLIFCSFFIATSTLANEDAETAPAVSLENSSAVLEAIAYMTDAQRDFEYQLCVADCKSHFSTASMISSQQSCINLCGSTRGLKVEILSF